MKNSNTHTNMERTNHESTEAEEDKLLDPIAKSILRNLQQQQQDDTTYFNTDHLTPPTTIDDVEDDDIKCNPLELTQNELIHCQTADEANAKNDNMGGQDYKYEEDYKPSYNNSPGTTPQPTLNPTITAKPTDAPVPLTASPSNAPTFSPTNSRK